MALAALLLSSPARAADWVEELPLLLPALRTCLAAERTGFADGAWRIGSAQVGIRLRHAGRTSYCIASLPEGAVQRRLALPQAPAPDAAATAFFLERPCARASRIQAEDGTVLGWLAQPAC